MLSRGDLFSGRHGVGVQMRDRVFANPSCAGAPSQSAHFLPVSVHPPCAGVVCTSQRKVRQCQQSSAAYSIGPETPALSSLPGVTACVGLLPGEVMLQNLPSVIAAQVWRAIVMDTTVWD